MVWWYLLLIDRVDGSPSGCPGFLDLSRGMEFCPGNPWSSVPTTSHMHTNDFTTFSVRYRLAVNLFLLISSRCRHKHSS